MSQPASRVATADDNRKKNPAAVLSFVDFIALGLPDAVLGVAWPALRTHFDLHQDALGSVIHPVADAAAIASVALRPVPVFRRRSPTSRFSEQVQ